jgi:hypothetical protein
MQSRTKAIVEGNAPADTLSRQSKRSQREELKAILENKWWPFKRADAKLLEKAYRKLKQAQANPTEEALL